jgi:phage shock protein A
MATLVRANINDLLDQAEDPEVMLNQILRDMEDQIRQAREQVAGMMAQETELAADMAEAQEQVGAWNDRAELAVRHGQDALARQALARMNDATTHANLYEQQLANQRQLVARLRSQLDALQNKYEQAMSNRDALIARHRRSQAQEQVTRATQAVSTTDYSNDLARMERRIRGEEAQAAAHAELAADDTSAYDDLDQHALDDQLAALKQRLGAGGSETQQM